MEYSNYVGIQRALVGWRGSSGCRFQGFPSCPLYNLSNEAVPVEFGDAIAVIDFVTTTPPAKPNPLKVYDWAGRSRVTFKEYEPENLLSALTTDVKAKLETFEGQVKDFTDIGVKLGADITAISQGWIPLRPPRLPLLLCCSLPLASLLPGLLSRLFGVQQFGLAH